MVGCAKQSKEGRSAEPVTPSPGAGQGALNQDTSGGGPKTGAQPVESPTVPTPTGSTTETNKPLDPSANADPNDPKQQARATGVLGNTDKFDDSPIDERRAKGGEGGGGAAKIQQPTVGSQPAEVLELESKNTRVQKAIDAHYGAINGCRKSARGTLEITITVDAAGNVTAAKLAASSTLKDATISDCVIAIVKKLKVGKGAKATAPVRITFN
jgi:outer membrane biosynthesis protein TonB